MTDRLGLVLGDGQEIEQPCCRCGQFASHFAAVTVDPDQPGALVCPACAERTVPGWPELVAAIDAVHQAVCYVGRTAEAPYLAGVLRGLADKVDDLADGRAVVAVATTVVVLGGQLHGVHAQRWITTRDQAPADQNGGTT